MISLLDDESLPTDVPGLEEEIAELDRRIAVCLEKMKSLMAEEDFAAGIFKSEEIHETKQLHMALRYQKDLRVARRNRLQLE